jgi:hypothetical protein
MIPKISSAALALALVFSQPARPASTEPDLAAVRAATARFQDVRKAIAEGYVRDPMDMCDTADMMGRPAAAGAMASITSGPTSLASRAHPTPA